MVEAFEDNYNNSQSAKQEIQKKEFEVKGYDPKKSPFENYMNLVDPNEDPFEMRRIQ